jgi:transcriptional regulator with XRE-family HTH domain
MKSPSDMHPFHDDPLTPWVSKASRKIRLSINLPQQWVADKSGISRCTLSDFERGKRPRLSLYEIERIANTLGVTLHVLLAIADQMRRTAAQTSQKQT